MGFSGVRLDGVRCLGTGLEGLRFTGSAFFGAVQYGSTGISTDLSRGRFEIWGCRGQTRIVVPLDCNCCL